MKAAHVFYEVASRRLADQMEQIDGLDSKITTTFGISTGILPLFAAAISFRQTALPWFAWLLIGLALASYLVIIFYCYKAFQVATFDLRPDLPTLKGHCEDYDETTMRWWVANECSTSIADNEPIINQKAQLLERAVALLPIEIAFLVGATLALLA